MRFATLTTAAVAIMATITTTVTTSSPTPGASACADITAALKPGTVIRPTSNATAYTAAQYAGFNPLNNILTPACIVQPTSTADVSQTMRAIYKSGANYAVRAGGHTGMAGWDSVAGGVLIDFSRMTAFAFNQAASTVSVEPGMRWGDVYAAAEKFGVCPMGGRVEHVGTGLLLGGGLSLLSPQYGYACDGLVSADVVMVDGKVKHVDATTDADLLRAIKGGGGRFGVVTKYELKAYPTGTSSDKLWYGGSITTLDPLGMSHMVQATEQFSLAPDDPRATLLSNVGYIKQADVPLWLGTAYMFYKGTQAEFNAAFKDMLAIPGAIIDTKPMSYLDAAATTPLGWKPTQAYKWMGGALYPSAQPSSPSVTLSIPLVQDLPTNWLATWQNARKFLVDNVAVLDSGFFSITPVGTTQIEQGYANGGNAMAPPSGRNYMHWLFSSILADGTTAFPPDFDAKRFEFLKNNPSSPGLPLLLNEVDVSQKTFQSYGWYDTLVKAYKRVDPTAFSITHQTGPTF